MDERPLARAPLGAMRAAPPLFELAHPGLFRPAPCGRDGYIGVESLGNQLAERCLARPLGPRRAAPQKRQRAIHLRVQAASGMLLPCRKAARIDAELLDLGLGIAQPAPCGELRADKGIPVATIVDSPHAHRAL